MKTEHHLLIARELLNCKPFVAKRSTREQRANISVWRDCRRVLIHALQMADSEFNPDTFFAETEKSNGRTF